MNEYHERITELFNEYYAAPKDGKPAPTERIKAADELIEDYIEKYGERPSKSILSRLATYILLDTLTDPHPDKMSRDEYPIMSKGQRKRRKEIPSKNVYYRREDFGGFRTVYEKSDEDAVGYVKRYPVYNVLNDEDSEGQDAEIDVLALLESAGLTDRQREAIELIFFEDLTQEQASKRMGVSDRAVRYFLSDGLAKIRRKFIETTS